MKWIGKTPALWNGLGPLLAILRPIVFAVFAARAHGRIGVDAFCNRRRP